MDPLEQTEALAKHLNLMIRRQGRSQREIERELKMGRGYVSQLLNGRVDLKVEQLFAILKAIGVEPAAFFLELYSHSEAGHEGDFNRARSLIQGSAARYLAQTLKKKGVLDEGEAAELLRRLDEGR